MSTDSFKQYVNILHKKEVRKNLIIGGSVLLIGILIVSFIIFSFSSKLNYVHSDFNVKLEQAMSTREQQVNRLQAGITQDHKRRWEIISVEKLIQYTQRNTAKKKRLKQEPMHNYATWIVDESTRHGLDISLVASVIAQESRFHTYAISNMQAQGLMQVMDETGRWLSKELGLVYTDDLRFDPQTNIKMGTWYLQYLIGKYDGSIIRALGHYNGGSYQSRAFVLRSKYKNHPEYKRPKLEVDAEYVALRARRLNQEELSSEELQRYTFLGDIRCAQNLVSETEHYIPEILERQEIFKSMMEDPSSIIMAPDTVQVDSVDGDQ